jgi:rhodanese-related sulfurtransferase
VTRLIDYEAFCGVPARDDHSRASTPYDAAPEEIASRLEQGQALQLVDVREPVEQQVSSILGAINIPLGLVSTHLTELDPSKSYVLFCRTGVRSAQALQILLSAGFLHVQNMRGGINAWADQVDSRMAKY